MQPAHNITLTVFGGTYWFNKSYDFEDDAKLVIQINTKVKNDHRKFLLNVVPNNKKHTDTAQLVTMQGRRVMSSFEFPRDVG